MEEMLPSSWPLRKTPDTKRDGFLLSRQQHVDVNTITIPQLCVKVVSQVSWTVLDMILSHMWCYWTATDSLGKFIVTWFSIISGGGKWKNSASAYITADVEKRVEGVFLQVEVFLNSHMVQQVPFHVQHGASLIVNHIRFLLVSIESR